MAKYTTEVRSICEFYAGLDESADYTGVDDVISSAIPKIFDFDFPIFDENYRAVLERKIIMHYYTREIGFETVALWKLWLNKELNEIMPYFNKLYLSEQFEFNPLHDVDYYIDHAGVGTHKGEKNTDGITRNSGTDTREIKNTGTDSRSINEQGTNTGTTTDQGNRSGNSTTNEDKDMWDKYSDTPQGTVSNLDNSTYLTNARNITEDNTEQTTSTETNSNTRTDNLAHSKNITDALAHGHNVEDSLEHGMNVKNDERETNDIKTTDDFLRHVYGKMGTVSYSDLILKYRETLLNIDMLIIQQLGDLFLNLW